MTSRFDIPEAHDAVSIDATVARLRKEIGSKCSSLLRRTARTSPIKVSSDRAALWKSKINHILGTKDSTFSIEELEGLLHKCDTISQEVERFER